MFDPDQFKAASAQLVADVALHEGMTTAAAEANAKAAEAKALAITAEASAVAANQVLALAADKRAASVKGLQDLLAALTAPADPTAQPLA